MKLQPPDSAPQSGQTSPRRGLVLLLAVFVIVNGLLLFLWGYQVQQGEDVAAKAVDTAEIQKRLPAEEISPKGNFSAPSSADPAVPAAEAAFTGWLEMQARARSSGAEIWAEAEHRAIAEMAAMGDAAKSEGRYREAAEVYGAATVRMQQLLSEREQRIAALKEEGQTALEEGRPATAEAIFLRLLRLDEQDASSRRGLERARVADAVRALTEEGQRLLRSGQPAAALEKARQARHLDDRSTRAVDLAAEAERMVKEQAFQKALGDFFQALEAGRFPAAEKAFARAAALRAGDPALVDARRQLDAARQAATLRTLERKFFDAIAAERWSDASRLLQQALAVDSQAGFALQYQQQVAFRMELDQRIDQVLDQPLRLRDERAYQAAVRLRDTAAGVSPSGRRLVSQQQALNDLIKRARQPVPVHFISDENSEVRVYTVGSLGRFNHHTLSLYPGKYTVVAQRPGYRDVRRMVIVPADGTLPPEVHIHCEEPI